MGLFVSYFMVLVQCFDVLLVVFLVRRVASSLAVFFVRSFFLVLRRIAASGDAVSPSSMRIAVLFSSSLEDGCLSCRSGFPSGCDRTSFCSASPSLPSGMLKYRSLKFSCSVF